MFFENSSQVFRIQQCTVRGWPWSRLEGVQCRISIGHLRKSKQFRALDRLFICHKFYVKVVIIFDSITLQSCRVGLSFVSPYFMIPWCQFFLCFIRSEEITSATKIPSLPNLPNAVTHHYTFFKFSKFRSFLKQQCKLASKQPFCNITM